MRIANDGRTVFEVASMFCGCGGMDIGFEGGFDYLGRHYPNNRFEVVWANDFNKNSAKMHDAWFGEGSCTVGDVTKIGAKDVPDFDILTGGFPCTSFSIVGKRLGVDDPRGVGVLFMEVCRFLKEKKPRAFVMENVRGLMSANEGTAYPLVMSSFKACGYYVKCALLKAERFGVPSTRHRVFFVGFRDFMEYAKFAYPGGSSDAVGAERILEEVADPEWITEEQMQHAKDREKFYPSVTEDISLPAGTVLGGLSATFNGGLAIRIGDKYRNFTMRELARIQSFPDDYELHSSRGATMYGLGNAVPPVLAWHVARSLEVVIGQI